MTTEYINIGRLYGINEKLNNNNGNSAGIDVDQCSIEQNESSYHIREVGPSLFFIEWPTINLSKTEQ